MSNRAYNNTTAMKALEQVDEELAVKVLSDPDLDGKELSEILTTSLMGHIVNRDTKEPMKLSNKVMAAGILNRIKQLEKEYKND
jgi:5S rRNA maturation endonuclease (ribonuclease M5)